MRNATLSINVCGLLSCLEDILRESFKIGATAHSHAHTRTRAHTHTHTQALAKAEVVVEPTESGVTGGCSEPNLGL